MQYINKIEIKGVAGSSATQTVDGRTAIKFNVCVASSYGPAIAVEWFNVIYWTEGPDEVVNKGDSVHVWGRLRMQKYITPDNTERRLPEIVADKICIEED